MKSMHRVKALLALALLAVLPAAWASAPKWITVNDVSIRYQVTGDGSDVVVLLPSTGKPLEYWDEILPSLLKPNRKILRYDMRGAGLSEKISEPITMQDEVDDLAALLDALNFKAPVMMIGTAFGGSVQMQYAAQFPHRVKGIVNISPSAELVARPARPWPPQPEAKPATPPADPFAFTYPVELRGHVERWNKYLAMHASNDAISKQLTERLIYSTPFADVMPKLQCPVLLVATTMYKRRTVQSVEELSKAIPKGQFVVIESGHDAPFQTPELVTPLLEKFMKENGF